MCRASYVNQFLVSLESVEQGAVSILFVVYVCSVPSSKSAASFQLSMNGWASKLSYQTKIDIQFECISTAVIPVIAALFETATFPICLWFKLKTEAVEHYGAIGHCGLNPGAHFQSVIHNTKCDMKDSRQSFCGFVEHDCHPSYQNKQLQKYVQFGKHARCVGGINAYLK